MSFYHITKGELEFDMRDTTFKKYMDFKFIQVTVKKGVKVYQELEAVECTSKHFEKFDHNFENFEYWKGKTILCPRMVDYGKL